MVLFREAHGWSQKDLVEKLREQGWTSVYQNTISRIEKGDRPVRYGEALAIAQVFGEPVEKFTLTPEHASLAVSLSSARQGHMFAAMDALAHQRRLEEARAKLREAVSKARAAGIEPTELPDGDRFALVSTTVEDELALALDELGDER